MTDLLFVYGTLLQPGNSFANYLKENGSFVSPGKIRGLLYDIGEYPGAVITADTDSFIYGSIFRLTNPIQNLRVIDNYEGYGLGQEVPDLYIRNEVLIETDKHIVKAWIYLYNLPVKGLRRIASGNYAEYMAQKKSPGS